MKGRYRVALMLGLVAVGATPLAAAQSDEPNSGPVLVMNNYRASVSVFAEDANGRLHRLGRVGRGHLGEFDIPAEVAAGSFRIRVYPLQPVWENPRDDFGVKTNPLDLQRMSVVTLWIEPDLTKSLVQVERG